MIPIFPMTDSRAARLHAPILATLAGQVPQVAYRAPHPADETRWQIHTIGQASYRVAQPVTFTPYAAAVPCSARCRFCSETLIEAGAGKPASSLRPGPAYVDQLAGALDQLVGLPLSYSLSGLETTDDPDWMCAMLDVLDEHGRRSPVEERVLYTNGAGLAGHAGQGRALDRLARFGLDWVEMSRHHMDAPVNDAIMRFRPGVAVARQDAFENMLAAVRTRVPVKLVCIVQGGGVAGVDDVMAYLDWASRMAVDSVIFREFSRLDERYAPNVTARYIDASRVGMDELLGNCLAHPAFAGQFTFEQITQGYYFWNLAGRYRSLNVVFEASDYTQMHRRHGTGDIYKLVLHANGNLCAGWNPERHVLLRPNGETRS